MENNYIEKVQAAILNFDRDTTCDLLRRALEEKMDPIDLMENGLTAAMAKIGDKFAKGEIFLPELMIGAEAMKAGMEVVKPAIEASQQTEKKEKKTIVVGTVKGDIHDIGLEIVALILDTGGYRVINLGVDISAERFVEAAKENNAVAVGMSALLTTTIPQMGAVVKALTEAGIRENVKVMVGGSSVSKEYADQIGADAYGVDAVDGLRQMDQLLN